MNPFVILQELPCNTCKAECCGPVPFTDSQYKKALNHLNSLPAEEVERLANQKREVLHCCFVDTENWRCAIYPVRPTLCQIYGRADHPRLTCPHAPERRYELSASYAASVTMFDKDEAYIFPEWPAIRRDMGTG